MKKHFSITLCIAMIFAMLVTLSGCGEKESEKFVGTWETELDMTETINEGFSEDAEMAKYLKVDDFKLTMVFTFHEDGTYKIDMDEEAFNNTYNGLVQSFKDGMKAYLEAPAKKEGLEISADEVLKLSGTTMDALVNESLDKNTLMESFSGIKTEGKFDAEDGRLYTTDSKTSEINKEEYESYEFISDSELKLVEPVGSDDEDLNELYPLTLKKK